MFSTTQEQLWIIDERDYVSMAIQFVPSGLSINRTADISPVKAVGRNLPQYHYAGGETELTFSFDLYEDGDVENSVIQRATWLQSFLWNGGTGERMSRVIIVFGQMFKNNETWVMTGCTINYDQFDPERNFLPIQAYVDCTFKLEMETIPNRRDTQWR